MAILGERYLLPALNKREQQDFEITFKVPNNLKVHLLGTFKVCINSTETRICTLLVTETNEHKIFKIFKLSASSLCLILL